MTTKPSDVARNIHRLERVAHLRWVPVKLMRVSPVAQRDLNEHRVDRIVANFDQEQFGTPTVNLREGHYYVIDGQHRVEAVRRLDEERQVQCWTYEGLTEDQEAEKFLKLNDTLTVTAMDKFTVGVQAGRDVESDINRVVQAAGLRVTRDKGEGAINAVGTLRRVYARSDAGTLSRTLRIIRDAYGDPGFEAPVIDGIGMLCARYNGELDEGVAVQRLGNLHGGVNGLIGRGEILRRQTGRPKGQCVAAAAVDVINAGRGGKKLPSWWREDT